MEVKYCSLLLSTVTLYLNDVYNCELYYNNNCELYYNNSCELYYNNNCELYYNNNCEFKKVVIMFYLRDIVHI
jgi:hypothetical protein